MRKEHVEPGSDKNGQDQIITRQGKGRVTRETKEIGLYTAIGKPKTNGRKAETRNFKQRTNY